MNDNISKWKEVDPRPTLERHADELEALARSYPDWADDPYCKYLFAIAWDLKQLARTGTPSQGV